MLEEGTHILGGTGVDWYRIESLSGLMQFDMTSLADGDTPPRDLNMELFDSNGVSVRANFTNTDNENFGFMAGSDGTYYLKVYWAAFPEGAPNGINLRYSLNVDLPAADVPDGNDNKATASLLGAGQHLVSSGTGVDWYRIETGPGKMDFTLNHTGATGPDGVEMDLNMELYNGSDVPLRGEFVSLGDETFSYLSPTTQTYYLKVYWAPFPDGAPNGYGLNYSLDVDLPVNTWSKELDFGPIRDASIAAYDIDNDGEDEIFVGTSKSFDAQANEILPGGLIVLEQDGTVKWSLSFPAISGPDPLTGKTYSSTSVTTAPIFSDVNGDGTIDIVIGVGGENRQEISTSGQPGDLGGVYAVDAHGNIIWQHINEDSFGSASDGPDGRPDGVYGAPRVFDIDADGVREVIVASWDHYLYILNGKTGAVERTVDLHDTAGASPALADLNNDGLYELVVAADITDNAAAGLPQQGGILHVLSNYGQSNIPGWMGQVGTSTGADFRGKFEEQSLWSSPQIVDLDRDGSLEIVQGTGNFFKDGRGQYVKVWNADGSLRFKLDTEGSVLASPLIADLDGDGRMEIIAATVNGRLQAWNASGSELFNTHVMPYDNITAGGTPDLPIVRTPVAVDLDNADDDLELLISIGSQLVMVDSDGTQLTNTTQVERAFNTYGGSPLVKDIDNDGLLDLITGGTTASQDRAVVYRWENIIDTTHDSYRSGNYQNTQSLHEIQSFVDRFYSTILNRNADAGGRNDWTDKLYAGVLSGADVARGFIASQEFINRGTSDEEFVNILYQAFFNRIADTGGFNVWMGVLQDGGSRLEVMEGFTGSREFANLSNSFGIRAEPQFGETSSNTIIAGDDGQDANVLRAGPGNNTLYDEGDQVEETRDNEKLIASQVYRLYGATLGRTPDGNGFESWYNALADGRIGLEQAAGGFTNSQEFQNTYGALTDGDFVELLYQNVLNRSADAGGLASWMQRLEDGESRASIVLGFSESREYKNNTNASLDGFMRTIKSEWIDVIEGGAGDDVMNGGLGGDVFVFRNGQGGNDTIHGFEPWDELQLSGFGFNSGADARSRMSQSGANVVFNHNGQTITFLDTTMAEMTRVRYNVS